MSIHLHFDTVLPRLLQRVDIAADTIRGDLFAPTDAAPNAQDLPDPFIDAQAIVVRPDTGIVLPGDALGASPTMQHAWIGSYRLRWADLAARSDWSEHAIWILPVTRQENRLLAPFNATVDSLAGRWPRQDLLARRGWQSLLTVFVPHRGAAIADCVVAVNAHPDHHPLVTPQPLLGGAMEAAEAALPQIDLLAPSSLAADAGADLTLQLRSRGLPLTAPCEVYLEATAGYLPRRRVIVEGGAATCRFQAQGLVAGETARIKAGWKFWPGAAEAEIAIV